jgi:hypothetical protein
MHHRAVMLGQVQALAQTLKPSKSILLTGIRDMLGQNELLGLLDHINQIVDDVQCPKTASMTQMQLCNCVKPEVNTFLDAARNRFNSLSEELQQQREAFENPASLPSAKLVHSKQYGWHLRFKREVLYTEAAASGSSKRRKVAPFTSELLFKGLGDSCVGRVLLKHSL